MASIYQSSFTGLPSGPFAKKLLKQRSEYSFRPSVRHQVQLDVVFTSKRVHADYVIKDFIMQGYIMLLYIVLFYLHVYSLMFLFASKPLVPETLMLRSTINFSMPFPSSAASCFSSLAPSGVVSLMDPPQRVWSAYFFKFSATQGELGDFVGGIRRPRSGPIVGCTSTG